MLSLVSRVQGMGKSSLSGCHLLERFDPRVNGPVQRHPVFSDSVKSAGFAFKRPAFQVLLRVRFQEIRLVRDEVAKTTFVQFPSALVVVLLMPLKRVRVPSFVWAFVAFVTRQTTRAQLAQEFGIEELLISGEMTALRALQIIALRLNGIEIPGNGKIHLLGKDKVLFANFA